MELNIAFKEQGGRNVYYDGRCWFVKPLYLGRDVEIGPSACWYYQNSKNTYYIISSTHSWRECADVLMIHLDKKSNRAFAGTRLK